MNCDATGCRSERCPAADRAETERAPVGLFFVLLKMTRSCQRLAFPIVIHGIAQFSRPDEKRCVSGIGTQFAFHEKVMNITASIGGAEGRGRLFCEGLRQETGIFYRDKTSSNFSVNDNRHASNCRIDPRFEFSTPLAGLFSRIKDLKKSTKTGRTENMSLMPAVAAFFG